MVTPHIPLSFFFKCFVRLRSFILVIYSKIVCFINNPQHLNIKYYLERRKIGHTTLRASPLRKLGLKLEALVKVLA